MFDLDHAIDAWARDVAGYCGASVDVAELKDHLHCLAEEQQRQGKTPGEAFAAAVEQMGERDELRAAYEAGLSWPRKLLRWDQRVHRRLVGRFSVAQLMTFVLLYSLLCAAVLLVRGEWLNWVLLVWFVPTMTVVADGRLQRAEHRFFKSLLRSKSSS